MENRSYTVQEWGWGEEAEKATFAGRGYQLLASVDESEPYEVDQTAIYLTPEGKFAYATASGCSCWDGDWGVTDFDSLDEIEALYAKEDISYYNPSFEGFKSLIAQAREAFAGSGQQAS